MTKADPNKLDKLIQQWKRQFFSNSTGATSGEDLPPDAAAASLGREIGKELVVLQRHASTTTTSSLSRTTQDKILALLTEPNSHQSIPHALFDSIAGAIRSQRAQQEEQDDYSWLGLWVPRLEEVVVDRNVRSKGRNSVVESLSGCIRAYSVYLVYTSGRTPQEVIDTVKRLRLGTSRMMLARETVSVIFQSQNFLGTLDVLSPLLAVTVLASSTTSGVERRVFLQHLWRTTWIAWNSLGFEKCLVFLQWTTKALNLFLWSCIGGDEDLEMDHMVALEFAMAWFAEVVDFAQALRAKMEEEEDETHDLRLAEWTQGLVRDTLPSLLGASFHHQLDWKPVLESFLGFVQESAAGFAVDTVTALRLAALAVTTPVSDDSHDLLRLLNTSVPSSSMSTRAILQGLALIKMSDPVDKEIAIELKQLWAEESMILLSENGSVASKARGFHLVDLVDDGGRSDLLKGILERSDFSNTQLTAAQQEATLFFAFAMLQDETRSAGAFGFLRKVLSRYPHLGISLLPILVEQLNLASIQGDGQALIRYLEFVCETLVGNSYCAQEVWNLVGVQWMQAHTPLSVRILMIRLYPKLCVGNKRLYRRVIDTLGLCVSDKQFEVRLAVAATLADLAQADCIRDVSDVIGWIQGFLTKEIESPTHALLVYYAIMSLHHLVLAEELDFDVVIKVLSKRLCPVSDFEAVLQLPLLTVEAFVLLLGDGEASTGTDDEDGGGDPQVRQLSPQVVSAVRALVSIGTTLAKRLEKAKDADTTKHLLRIRQNVVEALSRYSLDALGIDEEGIKAVAASADEITEKQSLPDSGERYAKIRNIVVNVMEYELQHEPQTATETLARKLLEYEEEVLGGSLWQKRGRSRLEARADRAQQQKSLDARSALPTGEDVKTYATSTSSWAGAIALLLSSEGTDMSTLRDNADSSIDSADPLSLVLAVQGYLHTCRRSLEKSQNLRRTLAEVRSWSETFVSPDAVHLALASFCIYATPHFLECEVDTAPFAQKTFEEVLRVYKNQGFQKEEVAKISLGLVGVACLRTGDTPLAYQALDSLEQSVRGYGGQQSFGAFYGMAAVAQAAAEESQASKPVIPADDGPALVSRVATFLVEELLSCYEDIGEVGEELIRCLRERKGSRSVVESIASLGSNAVSLLMTKHVIARALFISCALCLPSLSVVDATLIRAIFQLLDAMEWGAGKGIALASVLRSCRSNKILSERELEKIHLEYSATFESGIGHDKDEDDATATDGLDDIFYAINGMSWTPTPHAVRRLLVGNSELFDDDGCALSLIGSVLPIVSVPCLGFGQSFHSAPHLQSQATASEIRSIVGIISDAANRKNGSQYYHTGVILMGMLADAQDPPHEEDTVSAASAKASQAPAPADTKADAEAVAFAKLPQPQLGTLLSCVMEIIEISFESNLGQPIGPIAALQHLSVPGEFADGFIDPLLQRGELRKSCIALLGSQIRGRRRAVIDGKNFITLSVRLARASKEEWASWMGDTDGPALSFIESCVGIGPKIPTDSLKQCLVGLSDKCKASKDALIALFSSIRGLLASSTLSPKSTSVVRSVLIGDLFPLLYDAPHHTLLEQRNGTSVMKSFIDCIREIPLSFLDAATFFAKQVDLDEGTHSELLRSLTVLELVSSDYFNSTRRDDQELSTVVSWLSSRLSRSTANREEKDCLRRIAYSLAVASKKEVSAAKRDRLSSLFEVLLLTACEHFSLGVEILAVVLAVWCDGSGSDRSISLGYLATAATNIAEALTAPALAQFFRVAVADLPYNLATFGRDEKMSAHISNYLHRLFTRWSAEDAEQSTLALLRHAFFVCQTQRTQEDAFVVHASSFLANQA